MTAGWVVMMVLSKALEGELANTTSLDVIFEML